MADPLGIIGTISVVGHITHLLVKLGLDWKDVPADARHFINELQALKTALSETYANLIDNQDVLGAFNGRHSTLLSQLGATPQPTDTQQVKNELRGIVQAREESKESFFPRELKKRFKTYIADARPLTIHIPSAGKTILSSKTFIVIDALDECQEKYRKEFCKVLSEIQAISASSIFVTSRFIPDILARFKSSPSLEIRASKEDVQKYLENNMNELPAFVETNSKLQEEIKSSISEAVDGMFLLALICLDSLEDKLTPKKIRRALANIQQQRQGSSDDEKAQVLGRSYDQAMERINGQKPVGGLELDEENIPQIDSIFSVCAGLVTLDEESKIVRLVHFTAQEYLQKTQDR
ncbi:hypothetical protein EDB80DRAFT_686728 [Ilyonectria destructans]|nr:hypothetical protein EDB80DRAFT_686728 [Ilyonectria destructans]